MGRPGGTKPGVTASGVQANDLDLQGQVRPRRRLEVDDLTDPMAEQRLAER